MADGKDCRGGRTGPGMRQSQARRSCRCPIRYFPWLAGRPEHPPDCDIEVATQRVVMVSKFYLKRKERQSFRREDLPGSGSHSPGLRPVMPPVQRPR